jgi:hypothetical protein
LRKNRRNLIENLNNPNPVQSPEETKTQEVAMTTRPRFSLLNTKHSTQYAPLVVLGYYVREQDLFSPLRSRLAFPDGLHTRAPVMALLDVWVSILAGCRSVSQINTRLRPDRILAGAWGRRSFFEQSTIARILDACQSEQVQQLQSGVEQIYRWMGQAPQQIQAQASSLLDIDLTGMPASRKAQGSTKGYFGREKGGVGASCAGSVPQRMTKWWLPGCILAIP